MNYLADLQMELTPEERDILDGKQGPTLQKVMRTLVIYGQAVEAKRFVDIEWDGHFAIHHVLPGIGPRLEMIDELAEANLKTKYPFTLDPKPPLDFENLSLTLEQQRTFEEMFRDQAYYEQKMLQLGLRDQDAYTCTPYLAKVGNIPPRGTVLAWSESSCVVFANSVLGARTNRNAAIMDLMSNIAGKTPLFGLLTDEGRQATWLVKVCTSDLPHPQVLGGAIGMKVMEDVPYIVGLDRFLGAELNGRTADYLKEMGAACAAIGAVGLYHVENITPEAVEQGTNLLLDDRHSYIIDDQELQGIVNAYPVMWEQKDARPQKCLIGCPHLSLRELYWWTNEICGALQAKGQGKIAVETIICAAPQVLHSFKNDIETYERLKNTGAKLSVTCAEAYLDNELCAREAVVTNSNKLRYFTTARMFPDEQLVDIIVSGEIGSKV
jgi:hypothetical protein